MKTAQEFKDAGLEFVRGDEFYHEANKETAKFLCIIPSGQTFSGEVKVEYVDGYIGIHNVDNPEEDMPVTTFAWRTNTGEQPSFDGIIEFKIRSNCSEIGFPRKVSELNWSITNTVGDITEWRPVISEENSTEDELAATELSERAELAGDNENLIDLDDSLSIKDHLEKLQQEAKLGERQQFNGKEFELTNIAVGCQTWTPIEDLKHESIYTKEMHEAGELVGIGMKFKTAAGEYYAHDVNDKSVCFVDEDGFFVGIPIGLAQPIDTRTEEQKLVDEALSEVIGDCEAPLNSFEVVERMIKLGYRKDK